MKLLIGSLTLVAALALGLTDLAASYTGAFAIGGMLGLAYFALTRPKNHALARARNRADRVPEPCSQAEVEDFFRALSQARAGRTTPSSETKGTKQSPR